MSLRITKRSVYEEGSYPNITKIIWACGRLDSRVLQNFPNLQKLMIDSRYMQESLNAVSVCKQLVKLDCSDNDLASLEGIEGCPLLEVLMCSVNRLTDIQAVSCCPLLRLIDCSDNKLTSIDGVQSCLQLTDFRCSINNITSLVELEPCVLLQGLICRQNKISTLDSTLDSSHSWPQLHTLDCGANNLRDLTGLKVCPNLRDLRCGGGMTFRPLYRHQPKEDPNDPRSLVRDASSPNVLHFSRSSMLSTLKGIESCPMLKTLVCCYSSLTSLDPIQACTQLRSLDCDSNKIGSLDPIRACTQLRVLECDDNEIDSLDPIIYLRDLTSVYHRGNPIDVSPPAQRALDRIAAFNANNPRLEHSIYVDRQNVHDTHIQATVCKSVQALTADTRTPFTVDDIITADLSEHTKSRLIEYCEDTTVHTIHLLTYFELLGYVWARITRSPHTIELLRILEEQITDAECMCFTGRFNRTLSVLVGFYPEIKIEISDSSRISAIILAIKAELCPYDVNTHTDIATKKLIDAGYSLEHIQPWLDALDE